MPETNAPVNAADVPSSRTIFRSTLIAAGVALLLLITVVMPAEYGFDPTGVGGMLGLTEMGEIKVALAKEAATADSVEAAARASGAGNPASPGAVAPAIAASPGAPATPTTLQPDSSNTHVTEIVLRPNEGKEIKLAMRKDARVTYSWTTDRGVVNYDTHADAPGISYHGYGKGTGKAADEGVLVAAFDGMHGWFWRNRGSDVVTVTLRTNGDYQELKRM